MLVQPSSSAQDRHMGPHWRNRGAHWNEIFSALSKVRPTTWLEWTNPDLSSKNLDNFQIVNTTRSLPAASQSNSHLGIGSSGSLLFQVGTRVSSANRLCCSSAIVLLQLFCLFFYTLEFNPCLRYVNVLLVPPDRKGKNFMNLPSWRFVMSENKCLINIGMS